MVAFPRRIFEAKRRREILSARPNKLDWAKAAGVHQANNPPAMLYTIAVVLIILWLLGMVSAYTIHGFIHILLVVAIIVVLLRIISGRKPL